MLELHGAGWRRRYSETARVQDMYHAAARPSITAAVAERIKAQLVTLKERLKGLKKEKTRSKEIAALLQKISNLEKALRDAQGRATDIDAAVYDLKAVNPNVVAKVDARTPAEIIENIAAQGEIVATALARLKVLMAEEG